MDTTCFLAVEGRVSKRLASTRWDWSCFTSHFFHRKKISGGIFELKTYGPWKGTSHLLMCEMDGEFSDSSKPERFLTADLNRICQTEAAPQASGCCCSWWNLVIRWVGLVGFFSPVFFFFFESCDLKVLFFCILSAHSPTTVSRLLRS